MPTTEQELRAHLAKLYDDLRRLDLDALRRQHEQAQAAHQQAKLTIKPAHSHDAFAHDTLSAAAGAESHARQMLNRAMQSAGALRPEIERLERMLGGERRIADAEQRVSVATSMVESAAGAVTDAERVVATITGMIEVEERAFEASKAQAAGLLLAAVKAGADAGAVPGPSRDRIDTLAESKVGAEQELAAARAALQAAKASQQAAHKALAEAQADASELQHQIALAAYLEHLSAYLAACGKAGRQANMPDPRALALEALRASA